MCKFLRYIFLVLISVCCINVSAAGGAGAATADHPAYMKLSQVRPGQYMLSTSNVNEEYGKLKKKIREGKEVPYEDTGVISPYSKKRFGIVEVVFTSTGGAPEKQYVINDGHHHILSAMKWLSDDAPDKTRELVIPIGKWKTVVTDQTKAAFWAYGGGCKSIPAYLFDKDGVWRAPHITFEDLSHVEDYPLRYFAEVVSTKVDRKGSSDDYDAYRFPWWLRVDGGFPYIEFVLGEVFKAMYARHGIAITNDMADTIKADEEAGRTSYLVEHYRAELLAMLASFATVSDRAVLRAVDWVRMQRDCDTEGLKWNIPVLLESLDRRDDAQKARIAEIVAAHRAGAL